MKNKGQALIPSFLGAESDNLFYRTVLHKLSYILIRRMNRNYQEYSPLYQHYRKLDQQILAQKLKEIKNKKLKKSSSGLSLPRVSKHRQSRKYQQFLNESLISKHQSNLSQIKKQRSSYFSKIIGLNKSFDLAKLHLSQEKTKDKQNKNPSYVNHMAKTENSDTNRKVLSKRKSSQKIKV